MSYVITVPAVVQNVYNALTMSANAYERWGIITYSFDDLFFWRRAQWNIFLWGGYRIAQKYSVWSNPFHQPHFFTYYFLSLIRLRRFHRNVIKMINSISQSFFETTQWCEFKETKCFIYACHRVKYITTASLLKYRRYICVQNPIDGIDEC